MLNATRFLVIDTETTGVDLINDRVVEVAAVLVVGGRIVAAFTSYVNPQRSIPAGASSIHGLADKDVAEAPTWEELLPRLNTLASEADVLVAHNAPFDRAMLPGLVEMPWLDTLRLAQRDFPDLESHKNGALRYALDLRCPEANGMPSHRALSDAYVTARLLMRLVRDFPIEKSAVTLAREVQDPRVLTKPVWFGKHRGLGWSEVPKDYLKWIFGSSDFDEDVKHTARHWFGK